jgi:hypothetical protein
LGNVVLGFLQLGLELALLHQSTRSVRPT